MQTKLKKVLSDSHHSFFWGDKKSLSKNDETTKATFLSQIGLTIVLLLDIKKSEVPTRKSSGHIECKLLKFIKTNTLPNNPIATKQFDFCYEDINEDDLLSYLSQGIKSKVFM